METFILLNGIAVKSDIRLGEGIVLQPADTSHLDLKTAISACRHPDDIAVVAAFIPRISSQFRVSANSSSEVSAIAWNSSWDALLLSAIFQIELGFNIQSDTPAQYISTKSTLRAIHRHMSGFNDKNPFMVEEENARWLSEHFVTARQLLDEDSFQTAVHCLASMHWQPHPRIKLAVIWAGIEGIFGATSEIRFKVSLYLAIFLAPDNVGERKAIFDSAKKLYNIRSSAVHGATLKGDLSIAVAESAKLLNKLLIKCIEVGSLPREADLVP